MIDYSKIRAGKKCVMWTRVSTKYQDDNGGSIDTQKTLCRDYASEHKYQIVGDFGGKHESAKTPGPLIKAMMDKVKKDPTIGTILISEYDRFSRELWQATKMLEDLRRLGVIVIAVKFGMDTRTKEGMMMAQNTLAMAQWDNQNRTDKFVTGRIICLKQGIWCEKAPLGYYKEGKSRHTYCYLNEKGKLIRQAFRWKLQGMSNSEILVRLKTLGLSISKQTLHKIFVNPFYAGKVTHKLINNEIVDGKIEPAITYTEFLKVQDILSGRTGQYVHAKQNEKCPLTNYVLCSVDETPLTSYSVTKQTKTSTLRFDYYKCNKAGCRTNVSAKEMHEKYEDILSRYEIDPQHAKHFEGLIREALATISSDMLKQNTIWKKKLTDIENDIKAAKVRFATGKIDDDTYEVCMTEFNSRKDVVLLELEKCSGNISNLEKQIPLVVATITNIRDLWHNGNLETKKKIQKLVFPDGIFWNKENRNYLTQNVNSVFAIMDGYLGSYKKETEAETSTSVPLCG